MATSMAIGRLITPWDQAASELGQTHDAHDMTALQQDKRPRSQLRYTASTPSDLPSSLPCRRLSAAATEAAHADGHIAAPATPLSELQAGYQIQIHHRSPYAKPSLHHIHHAGFRYSDHTASSCAHGCADLEKYVPQHGPANHATEGSPVNASIRNASLHSRLRDTTTSLDGYIDDPRASHDHVRQEVNTSSAPEVQDAHGTQCPLIGYRDVSDKDAQDIRIPSSDIYLHQARTNGSSTSANTGSGLAEIHAIRPFVSTFKGSGCVGSPQRDTDSSTTHHHAQVSGFLNDVSYKGVLPSDRACLVNTSSPLDARQKPRGIKPGKTSTQVEQLVLKTAIDGQAAIHVPPRDSRSSSGASPFVSRSLSQSASANSTSSLTPRAATNNGLAVSIVPKRTHKKFLSPGSIVKHEYMQNDPGQVQGLNLVWAASARPSKRLSEEQKAQRKKKKETGTCPRCKKLKRVCEEYRANLYLPCVYCMTSKPKSITETCQLVANLLEIKFFRLGPPTDNSSHPLNFFRHRSNVFNVTNDPLAETLNIELTQDVGCSLHLKVSRFAADPNDKLAYEGNTRGVPYRLEMPPYCIGDIAAAERSIVQYMIQAKGSYFLQFLDKSNSLLRMTFDIICKRPMTSLVHKAMDIWAATRLIERTWKLCGTETFGIHPTNRDDDPWIGHVPVTPIMDQQLDQVVIQKILRPRRGILLRELKLRMYSDDLRKKNMFDIYLTLLILLNNAEMHLAGEREFALRYGFGGRYGPFGKYRDAQEQFHAARTMLGHFHYICRANDIFDMTPDYLSKHLALTTMEVQYLAWLKTYVKTEKVNMALIREQDQYETTGYWFHQMFDKQWKPGTGYIKEIVEKGAVVR